MHVIKDKFDENYNCNMKLEMFLTYMGLKIGFRFL